MRTPLGHVLVVDDELDIRDVLREYFETEGLTVALAAHGSEAIGRILERRPDVILLDLRLPGTQGWDVLRHIRTLEAEVPVIIVSANSDVQLARDLLTVGVFDYLTKPIDLSYLQKAVIAALSPAAPGPHEPER